MQTTTPDWVRAALADPYNWTRFAVSPGSKPSAVNPQAAPTAQTNTGR